jgi:hypothetical protein
MTGDKLKQDVLEWIEENKHLHLDRHPRAWQLSMANRLATHLDMKSAWDELAKHGATDGRHVMSFVFQSVENANNECRRLPSDDEKKRIAGLTKALDKLRAAIARAPFLDSAHFIDIDGKPVDFSWIIE